MSGGGLGDEVAKRAFGVVVAVVLLAAAGVPVARARGLSRYERSQPVYAMGTPEVMRVETPYGSVYGEVVRPVVPAGVRVPVILTVSPYNALRQPGIASPKPVQTPPENDPVAAYFVPRGYARAVFDVLGTHASSGCYDNGGPREQKAAAAVVDFLGEQRWSNGKVGMIGISYDGGTTLMAAVQRPKHLAAIVPQAALSRLYDHLYGGGVSRSKPPISSTDSYVFGLGVAAVPDRHHPAANVDVAASRAEECRRLEHHARSVEDDPVYDEYWAERDFRAMARRIDVPVLFEAGWLDTNVRAMQATRLFQLLRPGIPKRLSLGQWAHGSGRFADSLDLRHAWFDQFLLGLDTGVLDDPPVDTQPTHGDRRAEATWPPEGTTNVGIDLVSGPAAPGQAGLLEGPPSFTDNDPAFTGFESNAGDPTSTWVAYVTPPLTSDVRISGAPQLRLRMTSTNAETHYCATLLDRTESSIEIPSQGMLNTRNRNGLDRSDPLIPGQPYDAPIDMYDTDWIVPAGHQIWVFLSSSCVDGRSDNPIGSTNTVLAGSRLILPISAGAAALRPTR